MTETGREIGDALRGSFLFPLLDAEERSRFITASRPRVWPAGAAICTLGDPGSSMMLVRTGRVRVSHPSPEGRSFLLAELGPGAVFGEIALLDGGPRSADVVAVVETTLLVFERRDFLPLLERNWRLAEAVLKVICERLRRADSHIADLAFSDLPERLAKTLLARAQPGPRGRPPAVSDTQGALAAMIGGSREAVNRALRKWQRDGLIAIADGRIALTDPDALARLAGASDA